MGTPCRKGGFHQGDLRAHRVHRVNHIIEGREIELVSRLGKEEALARTHDARRIDRGHALGRHLRLWTPDSAHRGDNLPVEVRGIHRVGVDEIERPHPAASQRLHRIAAHSANAEHGHPSRRQAVETISPQQQPRPREKVIHESTPIFPKERRVSGTGALAKSFAKMVTKSTFELFVNRKPVIFSTETRKRGVKLAK